VEIFTGIRVEKVGRAGQFTVQAGERTFHATSLVVATGGLSIPRMGATGLGYELARQFGLEIIPTRPALVPLVLNAESKKRYCDLSGVSAEVIASIDKQSFREKMLITHRGLSGPAILQISSYWTSAEPIRVDLVPDAQVTAPLLAQGARRDISALKSALRSALPQRLADRWLDLHPPQGWSNRALEDWERKVHSWHVLPEGTAGYDKAEVTAGGVDTNELSAFLRAGWTSATLGPTILRSETAAVAAHFCRYSPAVIEGAPALPSLGSFAALAMAVRPVRRVVALHRSVRDADGPREGLNPPA